MAQASERWASKILALPTFSDEFAQAMLQSQYANLALISAMEVGSASEFVEKVHEWEAALDGKIKTAILSNEFMLEQYWGLASSVEKAFFESTATQLGFGMCDQSIRALSAESASARRSLAIKALLEKPAQQPRKLLKTAQEAQTATPLLDQENAVRVKWAQKLEAIGERAGSCSKLLSDTAGSNGLSAAETSKLRQLVLTSGAPRTMAVHISAWERFENWALANDLEVFPLSLDLFLKYALALDARECGPTVLPSFRTSVKWVTSKLAIPCPDLSDPKLIAVQNEIIKKRAKTLKEAVPFPQKAIECLEAFVVCEDEPMPARIFIWWWLCMIFASLRFDDAVHVKPIELIMNEEGLFGVAWQTKVERKRRGTKFAVPHVGFRDAGWLTRGWELFSLEDHDRDFWVRELNTREAFLEAPPTYQRSVQWIKFLVRYAVNHFFVGPEDQLKVCLLRCQGITAHSARVTLLDAAVHAGRSTEEIGLQANWKDPGPLVLKYTRNRSTVPAQMVQQLVKDMVSQQHPFEAPADAIIDDADETALDEVQFFVKTQTSRPDHDFRYHCSALGDDQMIACNRIPIEECTEVGATIPGLAMLCKHCAKARPDVRSRLEAATQS